MKITILSPKSEFTKEQQKNLDSFGEIVYTEAREEYPLKKLKELAESSEILGADPDSLGGFEKAMSGKFTELMKSLPELKGVALATTSFSWIDLNYCREKNIIVTNVPHYSTESVAEHVLGLMIALAKKIIVSDRRTQKGKYKPEMGRELKSKTLGVIGLGNIGSRVAELGNAIGMNIIAYNRSPKDQRNVEMKTLEEVLAKSDFISINIAHCENTHHLISKEELEKVKKNVAIVNLATREIVDETAMASALKNGKVDSYAFEGEDLNSGPLSNIETAIALKPFAWYTKEALERAAEIWTDSIISIAEDNPINVVN